MTAPAHRCSLPILWRTQQLAAGATWRCSCGRVRRLNSTYRPGNGVPRFLAVTK